MLVLWVSIKDNIVYLWMLDHRKWATVTELELLSSSQTVFHVLFLIFCHRQWSCGKVMFSFLCVCLFTIWVPREHYPWCIWSHCTGPQSSDLGPPTPAPPNTHRHQIWDLPGPGPLLVTSGGHHLIPVPTSFKGLEWHLVVAIEPCTVGASGQYASFLSFWIAFLP